ncbi:hypothetical protein [Verrucosispora sp. WMMC514]|uniref:hypothetical protein n=1 Tax=Verrucosispora sp. WMMC514 TaxID=3015156 RepID=UPI00248CA07C|nr:hypothetical protein [Verrucosispora sp. WMMC514]WBB94198.1 hypothetical protein O7597_15215 [Verrucosispora sp. WMMC514]
MARVEITTGGHSIVVDADGELDHVAGKALFLWTRTRDPQLDRPVTATGFAPVLERAPDPDQGGSAYELPYAANLTRPDTTKGGTGRARDC